MYPGRFASLAQSVSSPFLSHWPLAVKKTDTSNYRPAGSAACANYRLEQERAEDIVLASTMNRLHIVRASFVASWAVLSAQHTARVSVFASLRINRGPGAASVIEAQFGPWSMWVRVGRSPRDPSSYWGN